METKVADFESATLLNVEQYSFPHTTWSHSYLNPLGPEVVHKSQKWKYAQVL